MLMAGIEELGVPGGMTRALTINCTSDDGVTTRSPMTLKKAFATSRFGIEEAVFIADLYCESSKAEQSDRRTDGGRAISFWIVRGDFEDVPDTLWTISGVKYGSCSAGEAFGVVAWMRCC